MTLRNWGKEKRIGRVSFVWTILIELLQYNEGKIIITSICCTLTVCEALRICYYFGTSYSFYEGRSYCHHLKMRGPVKWSNLHRQVVEPDPLESTESSWRAYANYFAVTGLSLHYVWRYVHNLVVLPSWGEGDVCVCGLTWLAVDIVLGQSWWKGQVSAEPPYFIIPLFKILLVNLFFPQTLDYTCPPPPTAIYKETKTLFYKIRSFCFLSPHCFLK